MLRLWGGAPCHNLTAEPDGYLSEAGWDCSGCNFEYTCGNSWKEDAAVTRVAVSCGAAPA